MDHAPVKIEMFGSLRIRVGRQSVITRFRTEKTASLLAYLAYHLGREFSREVIVGQFWPEAPNLTAGRNSLSKALSSLRVQLEPPGIPPESVLLATRATIGLSAAGVSTDVGHFEQLIKAGARAGNQADKARFWEEAVALYTGPFLPELFDTWTGMARENLLAGLIEAAHFVGDRYAAEGRYAESAAALRRAMSADPHSDDTAYRLVKTLLDAGDNSAAVRQYNEFARFMASAGGDGESEGVRLLRELVAPYLTAAGGSSGFGRSFAANSGVTAVAERRRTVSPPPGIPPPPTARFGVSTARRNKKEDGRGDEGDEGDDEPSFFSTRLPAPSPSSEEAPLPVPLTPLFGREDEIAQIDALLAAGKQNCRLLTITGPAGVGKTRLALAVTQQWRQRRRGAAHYVSLADVARRHFSAVLCEALGIPPPGAGRPAAVTALAGALAAGGAESTLLVLDNFEQLTGGDAEGQAAVALVEDLLTRVRGLSLLVTSRVRVPIEGEIEFPVAPLSLPVGSLQEAIENGGPDRLLSTWPVLALFVDRARRAQQGFRLSARNADVVAELVRRLDGLPLAIELAASRIAIRTPAQMLPHLPHEYDLLVNHRRREGDRHRSLRSALAWSVDLLSPRLRDVFARLAVFRGGWTADAAEAVTGSETTLDDLAQLVGASLIQAAEVESEGFSDSDPDDPLAADAAMRFVVLETLRVFADDLLTGNERADAEARHMAFYTKRAEEIERYLQQGEQAQWLRMLAAEHGNVWAALDRTAAPPLTPDGTQTGLRLAVAVHRHWLVRGGHMGEGSAVLDRAISSFRDATADKGERDSTVLVGRALNAAGALLMRQGRIEAAHARFAEALSMRDLVVGGAGSASGAAVIAAALNNLAIIATETGDLEAACCYYRQSLAAWRAAGDRRREGMVLSNLAADAVRRESLPEADKYLSESLQIARATGDRRAQALRLNNLGELRFRQGQEEEAARLYRESLALRRELDDVPGAAYAIINIALLELVRGEDLPGLTMAAVATAVRFIARAEARLREAAVTLTPAWRNEIENGMGRAETVLGPEAVRAARHEGAGLDWDTVLESF